MQALVDLLLRHGVLLVFAVTLAARIGAPVPAAPLLVVAGGLAAGGQFSLAAAFAVAVLANVLGDAVWFVGGRRQGHRVMRLLCRVSLSPDSCVRRSENLIGRWGGSSLIAAKFVPGVSLVAAPMAGALAMPWRTFLLFEVIGGALWSLAFLVLGMVFSREIQRVLDVMASAGTSALIGLGLLLAALLVLRWWRRRRQALDMAMPRIGVEELRALLQGEAPPVVVDVRAASSLDIDARRIPGARQVELARIAALAGQLHPEQEIVVYCNCPNDVSAAQAARVLQSHGFRRVRPLAGGLDAWFAEDTLGQTSAAHSPTAH
ncbi:DedA family protein/thiosulfate sulfurtransferase GlpE [Azohydromonas caseinilytica]|uniref:Sulfurtransferase n=1 Tax=Azohydromonas caseinilytica TaxID=2728836 RepID=A0A848FFS0_9BURK|nr:DedA family protein/thiosulfate sulfurtransferase GlpE [Azohydromonas caseinilytica]NML17093.1 sulfurtransferase [Azohydromonas caseinilytica]